MAIQAEKTRAKLEPLVTSSCVTKFVCVSGERRRILPRHVFLRKEWRFFLVFFKGNFTSAIIIVEKQHNMEYRNCCMCMFVYFVVVVVVA